MALRRRGEPFLRAGRHHPPQHRAGHRIGTKGLQHQFDVYVTWFSPGSGTQQDPKFPGIVDTVMMALRYSQPNPAEITDPATNLTSTIYNVGESIRYRTGVEATADERWLRYDASLQVTVWGSA